MLVGIVVGIILACIIQRVLKNFEQDIVVVKRHYYLDCDATKQYNILSKYFNSHQKELKLVSMRFVSAYNMFNPSSNACIIIKYKVLDKDFNIDF